MTIDSCRDFGTGYPYVKHYSWLWNL